MSPQKKIALFLALTFVFSTFSYVPILITGSLYSMGGLFMLTLMWSPGIAGMVTQFLATRSLRGLGWRLGSNRWLGLAYILPVLYGLPVYFFAWLTGLGGLRIPEEAIALTERFRWISPIVGMGIFCFFSATVMVLVSLVTALGEEIGWRGLFVPELAKVASFTTAALISGLVWTAWHMPALFLADYGGSGPPAWYSVTFFAIMVISTSFAYAWLRLRSGSLWPAALLHASHNLFIMHVFDAMTVETDLTAFITGELGLGLALAGMTAAYLFWRKRETLQPIHERSGTTRSTEIGSNFVS